MYFVIRMRAKV